jgi:hypothetical protein
MSKFKITLKLTGLELQVEGSRDDVPLMTQAAGQQLAGLFGPASGVVEGEVITPSSSNQQNGSGTPEANKSKKKVSARSRNRVPGTPKSTGGDTQDVVDWIHDPAKWGSPQKKWSTRQKALWLLYVVAREMNVEGLSARAISKTFGKHFHQSGIIMVTNINRDLGLLKGKTPPEVAEDTTKVPSTWHLTSVGEQVAQALVAEALGTASGG